MLVGDARGTVGGAGGRVLGLEADPCAGVGGAGGRALPLREVAAVGFGGAVAVRASDLVAWLEEAPGLFAGGTGAGGGRAVV